MSLVRGNLQPYAVLSEQLRYALLVPGLATLALAGAGRLGASLASSRLRPVRRAGLGLAVPCAAYAGALSLVALGHALDSPEAQSIATVVAVPAALVLLIAARKDGHLSRRAFLRLFAGVSVGVLVALGVLALLLLSSGATLGLFGTAYFWLTVAAGESLLGLLAVLVYAARTGSWPLKSSSPPDGGVAAG